MAPASPMPRSLVMARYKSFALCSLRSRTSWAVSTPKSTNVFAVPYTATAFVGWSFALGTAIALFLRIDLKLI